MVANVNLDMVGRNAPDSLIGVGMELSTLGAHAREAAAGIMGLVPDPNPDERHFVRSDQYSFARAGVPAIFLTSGPHADYHRTSDEAARVDAAKVARVAALAVALVRSVADAEERPSWTAEGEALLRRIR